MGFFSSSFGTGLVTGIAQGAQRTIQTALDKREEELTSARKFLRERRAQKQDFAEQQDRRIEKAMRRLSSEFGGDNARALAVYEWAGGDVDAVEQFIKDVDETKRAKGDNFDMSAIVDFVGGNPEATGNLSFENVMDAVRYEYEDPSIEIEDTSGLANIGFGISDMAGRVKGSAMAGTAVGFKRKPIKDLATVNVDRTKLMPAIEYAYKQKQMDKETRLNGRERFYAIQDSIAMLDPTAPDYEEKKTKLQNEANAVIENVNRLAIAEEGTPQGGMSDSLYQTVYTKTVEAAIEASGYNAKDGTFIGEDGQRKFILTDGEEAMRMYQAARQKGQRDFVLNQRRADGTYSAGAMNIIRANGLEHFAKGVEIRSDDTTAESKTTASSAKPLKETKSQEEQDDVTRQTVPNAQSYIDTALQSVTDVSKLPMGEGTATDALLKDVMRIYNIDVETAANILFTTLQRKEMEQAEKSAAEKRDKVPAFDYRKMQQEQRAKNQSSAMNQANNEFYP